MISCEPLYNTLKKKNISTYKLIKEYNIRISTVTLNDLCNILNCNVQDIMTFIKD